MNEYIPDFSKYSDNELNEFLSQNSVNESHLEHAQIEHDKRNLEKELNVSDIEVNNNQKSSKEISLKKSRDSFRQLQGLTFYFIYQTGYFIYTLTQIEFVEIGTILYLIPAFIFILVNIIGSIFAFKQPYRGIKYLIFGQFFTIISFKFSNILYMFLASPNMTLGFSTSEGLKYQISLFEYVYYFGLSAGENPSFLIIINFIPIILILWLSKIRGQFIK